jgi:hypothetical protein
MIWRLPAPSPPPALRADTRASVGALISAAGTGAPSAVLLAYVVLALCRGRWLAVH